MRNLICVNINKNILSSVFFKIEFHFREAEKVLLLDLNFIHTYSIFMTKPTGLVSTSMSNFEPIPNLKMSRERHVLAAGLVARET